MKRTLFNTMMGCLAALSLAGCGGSGGGSSSVPTESLISEGFDWMEVTVDATSVRYGYKFYFYPNGDCEFYLKDGNGAKHHVDEAKWVATYQGNGVFRISISGGALTTTPNITAGQENCTISFEQQIELNIPNMERYRDGKVVNDAHFTSAPFTHDKKNGCPLPNGMYVIETWIDSIKQWKSE